MERCSSLCPCKESVWGVTSLLSSLRQLVVAAVVQAGSFPCSQQQLVACPEQHLSWGPAAAPSWTGPWVVVRISPPLLLLSGPFLSKFLGKWLWRVNIHTLGCQSLICTPLGCTVWLFHPLPSAQEWGSSPQWMTGLGKVRKPESCVLLIKALQKFPWSPQLSLATNKCVRNCVP